VTKWSEKVKEKVVVQIDYMLLSCKTSNLPKTTTSNTNGKEVFK
jgi:hypothetical protein